MSAETIAEELDKLKIKARDGLSAEERLERIKAAANDYLENPQLKIDELADKHGIPRRTLYYYFRKLGIVKAAEKERVSVAEKAIRKTEIGALTEEAEKIATIAIRIGGVIARQYLPLINHLISKGRTLEMIAGDIMAWYEMKIPTETHITDLEKEIQGLNLKLTEAYTIAAPNFRYMLRAKIVENYAKHLLVARLNGLRVPFRSTLRALQNDLIELERDLEEIGMFVS